MGGVEDGSSGSPRRSSNEKRLSTISKSSKVQRAGNDRRSSNAANTQRPGNRRESTTSNSGRSDPRRNSLFEKSSLIYDAGTKFKRLPSGRVNPAMGRCDNARLQVTTDQHQQNSNETNISSANSNNTNSTDNSSYKQKQFLHVDSLAPYNVRNNLNNVLAKVSSRMSVLSAEHIMCKESFLSGENLGGRGVQRFPTKTSHDDCVLLNNDTVSGDSMDSNDDRILSHLIGNYDGPDRVGFTAEIVREVQGMSDLSTDSVVDFLLSKEYQRWIKQKANEWQETMAFKSKLNSTTSVKPNPYVFVPGDKKRDSEPKAVPLVQIFQESGSDHVVGVQNHYNYDIKINTNGARARRCGNIGKGCCVVL